MSGKDKGAGSAENGCMGGGTFLLLLVEIFGRCVAPAFMPGKHL